MKSLGDFLFLILGSLHPVKLKTDVVEKKHSLEMLDAGNVRTNKQIPILVCDSTLVGFHFWIWESFSGQNACSRTHLAPSVELM